MSDVQDVRSDEASQLQPIDGRTSLGYRPELDGLRAVAVLAVIGFHYWEGSRLTRGGFLGVDLFFVLSGFLITRLLLEERERKNRIDVRAFYVRRAARLFPAIVLVCAVVVVDALTAQALAPARTSAFGVVATLGYFANWVRVFGFNESPLGHAWSLSIEEQFYLLWPVVLMLLARRGGVQRVRRGAAVVFVVAAVQMAVRSFVGVDSYVLYNSTDAHGFVTLMAGCLLATVIPTGEALSSHWLGVLSRRAFIPLLIGFGVLVVGPDGRDPFYYRWGLVLASIGFALIICRVLQPSLSRTVLQQGVLVWIGRLSYGLYLWHLLAFEFVLSWSDSEVPTHPIRLAALALAFVAATLSFYVVEQPVRRAVTSRFSRRRARRVAA